MSADVAATGVSGPRRGYLLRLTLVAALGGLLFGYDTAVISGALVFVRQDFALGPAQVGWTVSSALLGAAIGAALAGSLSDRIGRKKVLLAAATLFLVSAVGTALPESFSQLLVMRLVGGIGVGFVAVVSPLYIAEVAPARMRGRLVSTYQLAIVSGFLIVYFVNYTISISGTAEWNVTTGWRWMFASEIVPALIMLVSVFFVPESPRWLVHHGQREEAADILRRIVGEARTGELMEDMPSAEHKPDVHRRPIPHQRTLILIGVTLAVLQQITGINVLIYFAPDILERVTGVDATSALQETIILGGANLVFTVVAVLTVDRLGRRPLMLVGFAGMAVCMGVVAWDVYADDVSGFILLFVLGYILFFAVSVGPVTWVILSEIFPTQIRGRAMGIAVTANWLANVAVSQTFARMEASPWLVAQFNHSFPFFLYALFGVVAVYFVYRAIPETKGHTLEEIEARLWPEAKAASEPGR